MKAQMGEQRYSATLSSTLVLDWGGWSSHPSKRPSTHWTGGWMGPRPVCIGAENLAPLGFKPQTVQPIVNSTFTSFPKLCNDSPHRTQVKYMKEVHFWQQ